jgi:hypothetical protein
MEELASKSLELDSNYIPIDFDAYTIEDRELILNSGEKLNESDKIWRISSLTAFVDEETKILLLPQPESKREVKIKDTKYEFQKVGDLMERKAKIEKDLEPEEQQEDKRYEEMTSEELHKAMKKKR